MSALGQKRTFRKSDQCPLTPESGHGWCPSGSFRHSDIEDKHAEAAEQENSATKPPRGWGKRSDDAGNRDDRDDRKRKRAILNKQSDKFAERRNPVYHHGVFRHAIAMRHLRRRYAC